MCRVSEGTPSTSKGRLHPEKILLKIQKDAKEIFQWKFFIPNQTFNPDLYYQQLGRLQAQPTSKWSTLINRGGILFHHENARYQGFDTNYWTLVGKFYLIRHAALTLQFRTNTYFDHYTTTTLEESSMMWGCKNIVTTVF